MRNAVQVVNSMLSPNNPKPSDVTQLGYDVVASAKPDNPRPVQAAMYVAPRNRCTRRNRRRSLAMN